MRDPQVYVRPVAYRPIRIYVGGEVKRPGYYTLSGSQELSNLSARQKDSNCKRALSVRASDKSQ